MKKIILLLSIIFSLISCGPLSQSNEPQEIAYGLTGPGIVTDTELKSYFEIGDYPTAAEFAKLIDSKMHVDSLGVLKNLRTIPSNPDGNTPISPPLVQVSSSGHLWYYYGGVWSDVSGSYLNLDLTNGSLLLSDNNGNISDVGDSLSYNSELNQVELITNLKLNGTYIANAIHYRQIDYDSVFNRPLTQDGIINSFLIENVGLGDSIGRPDIINHLWKYNVQPIPAQTKINPSEAIFGENFENHYYSNDNNGSFHKNTFEHYSVFKSDDNLVAYRPEFLQITKDGLFSVKYWKSGSFRFVEPINDVLKVNLDLDLNKALFENQMTLDFNYNNATYIKGLNNLGQTANLIGLSSTNILELGGAGVDDVLINEDVTVKTLGITSMQDVSGDNAYLKLVWHPTNKTLGYISESDWATSANDRSLYFNIGANDNSKFAWNDNTFDYTWTYKKDFPTSGWKGKNFLYPSGMAATTFLADNTYYWKGMLDAVNGGVYNKFVSKSIGGLGGVASLNRGYIEGDGSRFAGFHYDIIKNNNGVGASIGNNGMIAAWQNNSDTKLVISGDGRLSINLGNSGNNPIHGNETLNVGGTGGFTGTVSGATPVNVDDLTTKGYVDALIDIVRHYFNLATPSQTVITVGSYTAATHFDFDLYIDGVRYDGASGGNITAFDPAGGTVTVTGLAGGERIIFKGVQ